MLTLLCELGEILVTPPPKFFSSLTQMARVSLLTDYSEDKKSISGGVFSKDQIRKVHAFAQPRSQGFSIRE